MKNSDHSLDRLLQAAAQSSASRPGRAMPEEEPPFGFTARVVSGWLAATGRDRMGIEALWFRRALLCAVAVMAVSVSWSYKEVTIAPNDDMAIASYDASADLP